jgi:hypothetical protein
MMRASLFALVLVLIAPATRAIDVTAIISSEHNYALYTAVPTGAEVALVGSNATPAAMPAAGPLNWREPDRHRFAIQGETHVYLVVWPRPNAEDGLLAQFEAEGVKLLSGDGMWRVFATGMTAYPNDPPPAPAALRNFIIAANSHHAWQSIENGARNDTAARGMVAEIEPDAYWMWTPPTADEPVFVRSGGEQFSEFLVFRTTVLALMPEIEEYGIGAIGGRPYALGSQLADLGVPPIAGSGGSSSGASGAGGLSSGGAASPAPIAPPVVFNPPPLIPSPPAPQDGPDPGLTPGGPGGPGGPLIPEPSTGLLLMSLAMLRGVWRR